MNGLPVQNRRSPDKLRVRTGSRAFQQVKEKVENLFVAWFVERGFNIPTELIVDGKTDHRIGSGRCVVESARMSERDIDDRRGAPTEVIQVLGGDSFRESEIDPDPVVPFQRCDPGLEVSEVGRCDPDQGTSGDQRDFAARHGIVDEVDKGHRLRLTSLAEPVLENRTGVANDGTVGMMELLRGVEVSKGDIGNGRGEREGMDTVGSADLDWSFVSPLASAVDKEMTDDHQRALAGMAIRQTLHDLCKTPIISLMRSLFVVDGDREKFMQSGLGRIGKKKKGDLVAGGNADAREGWSRVDTGDPSRTQIERPRIVFRSTERHDAMRPGEGFCGDQMIGGVMIAGDDDNGAATTISKTRGCFEVESLRFDGRRVGIENVAGDHHDVDTLALGDPADLAEQRLLFREAGASLKAGAKVSVGGVKESHGNSSLARSGSHSSVRADGQSRYSIVPAFPPRSALHGSTRTDRI